MKLESLGRSSCINSVFINPRCSNWLYPNRNKLYLLWFSKITFLQSPKKIELIWVIPFDFVRISWEIELTKTSQFDYVQFSPGDKVKLFPKHLLKHRAQHCCTVYPPLKHVVQWFAQQFWIVSEAELDPTSAAIARNTSRNIEMNGYWIWIEFEELTTLMAA